MKLTYAQYVEVMSFLHWVREPGLGAFKARLGKLQIEGVPLGSNPGKGKRVEYTLRMLFEAAMALELSQCGWSPADVAALIKTNRSEFLWVCLWAAGLELEPEEDPFVMISPEALRNRNSPSLDEPMLWGAVSFVSRAALVKLFAESHEMEVITGATWRWAIIDVRSVIHALIGLLGTLGDDVDVFEEIRTECIEHAGELADFVNGTINRAVPVHVPRYLKNFTESSAAFSGVEIPELDKRGLPKSWGDEDG